ncbi:hypothetical protein EDB85DRAFT_2225000 [Lactarius pseudohatsudake]|nr:hypothetical protein EDB85DRAFT_2225000 [Lactarius pseudohatsudake]
MPTATSRANRRDRLPRVIGELSGVGGSMDVVMGEKGGIDRLYGPVRASGSSCTRIRPGSIHLKEISFDFIKTRPTSNLELVFKEDAGVTHKSNKFKNRTASLFGGTSTSLLKIKVVEISVKFKPDEFGDGKVVRLEGGNVLLPYSLPHAEHRVNRAQTQHFTSLHPGMSWSKVGPRRSSIRLEEGLLDCQDVDGIKIEGPRSA